MAADGDKYKVIEKIGQGSFGVIHKVQRKSDGFIMCRKEISYLKMSQKEREQLHAEFQILSHLKHPNIVAYYHREHLKQTQDLHLYMEYCGNGDLGRVIKDLALKSQYAQESFVWSIFSQLITALYRCHYGIDPPEVGTNVLGLFTNSARPKTPAGSMTILHRDLKPENVFLGEDNSVKLGDFGLSKMIQSHDFASTYVGTPFYMSPEICAAEKYTLKSDIWSLGCIIYELCAREPPFNAKTHYNLISKIKKGVISPLPDIYSEELNQVIRDCLKVNPDHRPDTASLLNLPIVRLMRKEKEVVDINKSLRVREETLARREQEVEDQLATLSSDRLAARQEIDASLRREWEVKARLEIDQQVTSELERLQDKFEREVQLRVDLELQRRTGASSSPTEGVEEPTSGPTVDDQGEGIIAPGHPYSSVGAASADDDFPSTTDISEFSVESPEAFRPRADAIKKSAHMRTPFARAQTMFAGHAGTPMDIEMSSPSPIAIASLSLSPRRNAGAKAPRIPSGNLFANLQMSDKPVWSLPRDPGSLMVESDTEDEIDRGDASHEEPVSGDVFYSPSKSPLLSVPSSSSKKGPINPQSNLAATKAETRPPVSSHRSAPPPTRATKAQPTAGTKAASVMPPPQLTAVQSAPDLGRGGGKERCPSPNRRLSKIPSAATLTVEGPALPGPTGLARKPSTNKKDNEAAALLGKLAAKNNIKGRTLVELQQARAGGRPLPALGPTPAVGGENSSPRRAFRDRVVEQRNSGSNDPKLGPAPVWDPDMEDMPSPFIVRRKVATTKA